MSHALAHLSDHREPFLNGEIWQYVMKYTLCFKLLSNKQTHLVSCGGCAPRVCPPTIGGNVKETEGLQTELPDPVSQILSITLQQSGSY